MFLMIDHIFIVKPAENDIPKSYSVGGTYIDNYFLLEINH